MKNPFRMLLCAVLFAAFISAAGAQNVNRAELESNQGSVNFINYEGPHARIDTVEQIRAIGVDLGLAVKNGAARAGLGNRYFVIHCTGGPDGDKYDADVFGLGADVGVDHVRNLRLIIQGYLQAAYDYSAADASVLSRYITIYNAVFRGDWNFYSSRYKSIVTENLVQDRVGLSIRYDEWPGQTLMTIPLGTGVPGSLSAIDTSGLTDPSVIDSMRSEEGRGIEDRQDMVDLKERESEEASQSATLQREAIAEQERIIERDREIAAQNQQRLEQERQQAQQQAQQAEQARQQAQQAQQQAQQQAEQARQQAEQARRDEEAGRISAEEAQRQQEEAQRRQEEAQRQQILAQQQEQQAREQVQQADQRAQELTEEQRANEQRQQEIAQREQEQEQRRQEAEAAQQLADQKAQEAQQERQQIAQDQQEMIDSGSAAGAAIAAAAPGTARANGLLAAGISQPNTSIGQLHKVDTNNSGNVVQTSVMTSVNTRTIIIQGNRIFAIAGINRGNAAIRLVEIHNDSLNMIKQGDDDISPNSLLWASGNSLYAITVVEGKSYLARFDTNLAKQAQSAAEVHTLASCIFQGDRILTQKPDGTPLVLNGQTLR